MVYDKTLQTYVGHATCIFTWSKFLGYTYAYIVGSMLVCQSNTCTVQYKANVNGLLTLLCHKVNSSTPRSIKG